MTAGLEDIIESDEVRLDICVRIGYRIAHSGLGSEINDYVEIILREEFVNQRFISDVATNKSPFAVQCLYLRETEIFEGRIVIIVHIVNADDMCGWNVLHQAHGEVGANKTCCSGEQDGFVI